MSRFGKVIGAADEVGGELGKKEAKTAAKNASESVAEQAGKKGKKVAVKTGKRLGAEIKRKLGKGTVGARRVVSSDAKKDCNKFFSKIGEKTKGLRKADRQAAVRNAWRQERDLVKETGRGTRPWTRQEKKELLENGKIKGYEGHHINNVKDHPELARNPDNIKFLKGRREHLDEHGGNFKNKTSGDLINRTQGGVDP